MKPIKIVGYGALRAYHKGGCLIAVTRIIDVTLNAQPATLDEKNCVFTLKIDNNSNSLILQVNKVLF